MSPAAIDVRRLSADDLRYFLAVANTGRLVSAAESLGVNHATVARRIQALEKVIGARLMERGTDGWTLTEIGRTVAENARPIEQALEGVALAAAGQRDDTLTGTFRITAPDGFGTAFVVPALVKVQAQHPNLRVELVTATRQLNLHQAGFDLVIAIGAPHSTRLFAERLTEYDLHLYASEDYLARRGTPSNLDELRAAHGLVFYVDSLLQVGDLDLNHYARGMVTKFASTNIFAQLEATIAGAGIALLPQFLAVRSPQLRQLTEIGLHVRLSFTLAARRDSVSRPAVQAVRAALQHEVRSRRADLLSGDSAVPLG